MDPNETLREIRELIDTPTSDAEVTGRLMEIAERFQVLDGWLSRGGFWPSGWNQNGGATCGRCAHGKP